MALEKNAFYFVQAEGLWWYSIIPGSGSSQLSGVLCNHIFVVVVFLKKYGLNMLRVACVSE